MFTGIIQHVGRVVAASPRGGGRRLTLDVGPLAEGLEPGASLAVSGACLTARAVRGDRAEFDAVAETISRTTLGTLRAGDRVNLERSLRLGDGLDGHLVQGHVDGIAEVRQIERSGGAGGQRLVRFAAPKDLTDLMVPKGSIAVDGVSLTLVEAAEGVFSVALIPETLERTTLGDLAPGRQVNIETDVLGKYVKKFVAATTTPAATDGKGITIEKLRETGFLWEGQAR
jgi:riboflavin synthase